MNYCSGCHSAQYVRYNTLARDLELSDDQVANNLMFNAEKTFETIVASMPADAASRWFGQLPPDLSLIARSKGTDYVFNFLKGFHVDLASPTGTDNLVLAGTSMPNVLWELQGLQRAVFHEEEVAGQEVNIRDLSGDRTLVRFGTGDEVTVQAGPNGIRFLLISGAPINEPVAWHGPIVMNTQEELMQAMKELRNGTFIKPAH